MWRWAGIAAFGLIVFGPLIALCAVAAHAVAADGMPALAAAIPTGRRLSVFVNSLALAAAVGAGGSIFGVFAASALWSWSTKTGRTLRWLLLVAAPVPPYVHALAWSLLGRWLTGWMASLGLAGLPLDGWAASWWVQTMAFAPLAVALALVGLESIDPRIIAAARMLREDGASLVRVALPLAAPPLACGAGFLAVLSLADYTVPSLFSVNVYALEIFAEYSASNDPAAALLSAVPVMLVAVAIVVASQSVLRDATVRPPWRDHAWAVPPRWPSWLVWSQRGALFVLAAQIAVPLTSLIIRTGSWRTLADAAAGAGREMSFTGWTALLAALLSVPLGMAVAPALGSTSRHAGWWWSLVVVPLAVPSPLVGIGLVTIWNRAEMPPVYGTWMMPVLAALARFAPIAAIVLRAQLRRLDPAMIEAARVLEASRARIWLRVVLPLMAPGLAAAAAAVFALTAGELGATLIVTPPGRATLTLRIYNFLHYGASDMVGGLCLVMTGLVMGAGILGVLLVAAWSRAGAHTAERTA
jgi:iron(III) transport system permease protein